MFTEKRIAFVIRTPVQMPACKTGSHTDITYDCNSETTINQVVKIISMAKIYRATGFEVIDFLIIKRLEIEFGYWVNRARML